MKKILLILLILFNTCTVFSQTSDKNINEFIISFRQLFFPLEPGGSAKIFTPKFNLTLIIIPIKKNFEVDTFYLSDNAPKWQKDEVKGMLKRVKLFKISQYAKQKNFTGKIVFPFIFKTEKLNKKVELSEIYDSLQFLFDEKGNPIIGNVLLQEPIIVFETDKWYRK